MQKNRLNKLYVLGAGLVLFAQTHAQTGFRYKASLDAVYESGFYQIVLQPALAARLQPGLQDIRIADAQGKQVPYILKTEVPSFGGIAINELRIISNKKEADKQTHVIIENTLSQPLSQLLLEITNTAANRTATLSGSEDNNTWYIIKENIQLTPLVTPGGDYSEQVLDFPKSYYRYFNIGINGKDLLPVNIVNAGVYVPSPVKVKYLPLPAPHLLQKDSGNKYSYVFLRFKEDYFIDKLELHASGAKFYKRKLLIYTGSIGSAQLAGQYVLQSDSPAIFPLSVKTDHLLLKIQNDDNPPLQIDTASASQLNKYLLTWLEKGNAYSLLFGDSAAAAPVYDLQYFKDRIGRPSLQLEYGKTELNKPAPQPPAAAPPGNRWLIWVALGAACIVLLLLTAKMLGAINKRNA